jgi:hypothetical protein
MLFILLALKYQLLQLILLKSKMPSGKWTKEWTIYAIICFSIAFISFKLSKIYDKDGSENKTSGCLFEIAKYSFFATLIFIIPLGIWLQTIIGGIIGLVIVGFILIAIIIAIWQWINPKKK